MDNLKSLIPVSYDNPERPTVSGRELQEFLEVNTPYRIWFPRMVEYGFTEGEDFNPYKMYEFSRKATERWNARLTTTNSPSQWPKSCA